MSSTVTVDEWDHSPLGPSASERWMECPGSVLATKDIPDQSSVYAIEGTAGHTVTEWCREQGVDASTFLGTRVRVKLSNKGKNGEDLYTEVVVDQEMVDCANSFCEYVDQFKGMMLVEERVHYDTWVPHGFGTSDDIRLADKLCVISDFKFGKGIQVYAEDNPQLKMYALGVLDTYGYLYDIEEFQLNVFQPRLGHIDEWTVSVADLLKWAEEEVRPKAQLALTPGAPMKSGSWCQFCRIRLDCKERARKNFEDTIGDFDDLDKETVVDRKEVDLLTTDEIGLLLPFISEGKKFWTELETHALSLIGKGETITHPVMGDYKLVEGRSNRVWKNIAEGEETREAAIERRLREEKLKVRDIYTHTLKGPAAIEKVLGKKHPIFEELVEKPPGKPKLAPGTDKRPSIAIDPNMEFDELPEEND